MGVWVGGLVVSFAGGIDLEKHGEAPPTVLQGVGSGGGGGPTAVSGEWAEEEEESVNLSLQVRPPWHTKEYGSVCNILNFG